MPGIQHIRFSLDPHDFDACYAFEAHHSASELYWSDAVPCSNVVDCLVDVLRGGIWDED
jgi:hypothetical protein